jgi:hypothetical protein
MTDAQTLRQVAQARTPFSAWLGVVLLFFLFGLLVFAVIGPSTRGSDYEQKRAANREAKLKAQHEQDAAALSGYAWIDKNKGTVRIPIERAMELSLPDLARKKPAAAGPIATPAPSEAPATAGAAASPGAASIPAGSPHPSATPKRATIEGPGAKPQPAAGTNPPGAAPATQPGASASPAATSASVGIPPSPPPPAATPPSAGTPLPVRGKSPEGQ